MVLHHIPEYARLVVVTAAALDIDCFANVELDIVNIFVVPQRFEHAVGKAEGEQILHGFLTEVMVDAVDLAFIPVPENGFIQIERGLQVGAKGFFDNNALPAITLLKPCLVKKLAQRAEETWCQRKIKHYIASGMVLFAE